MHSSAYKSENKENEAGSAYDSSAVFPSDNPKSNSSSAGAKKTPPTMANDGNNESTKRAVSKGEALTTSSEVKRLFNQIPIRASNDASKKEGITPTPTSTPWAKAANDLTTLLRHLRIEADAKESSTRTTKVSQQDDEDASEDDDDEEAASARKLDGTDGDGHSPKEGTEASAMLDAPQTPLLELVKFYSTFASVSRNWKLLVDKLIVSLGGLVRVDFDELSTQRSQQAIAWLCHHKPKLAAVTGLFPASAKLALGDMMRKCDTEDLVEIGILLVVRATCEHNAESKAQRDLQDVVAEECPKLTAVRIEFAMECGVEARSEYPVLSPHFFSLSTVQVTFISFLDTGSSVSPGFIKNLIGNFPSLSMAVLRSQGGILSDRDTVVTIASGSLKTLSVPLFNGSQGALLSLDCPNLQHFVCSGEKRIDWADGRPIIYAREKVVSANVAEECCATVEFDESGKYDLDVPFHFLLGPVVRRSLGGMNDWYDDDYESD